MIDPELRKTVKDISGGIAVLIGVGFLLQGAFGSGNGWFLIAFIVTGLAWLSIFTNDRDKKRDAAVRKAFGVPEAELHGMFALDSEKITYLLNHPEAMSDYAAQLSAGMAPHYRRALEDPNVSEDEKATYRKALGESE